MHICDKLYNIIGFRSQAFFLHNRNNMRANIDEDGSYCVITVQLFCTSWRKVASEIERKLMNGL